MSWIAVGVGVVSIASGVINNKAAASANKQTQAGIASAANTIQQSGDKGAALLNPYTKAGTSSLPVVQQSLQDQSEAGAVGTKGLETASSQPLDVKGFLDPSAAFATKQGTDAIQASAAARGNLVSGATLKSLTKYATDEGTTNYNNAAQLALANKGQNINASGQLAGQGTNALSGLLNIYGTGANAAGTQANIVGSEGTNIANLQMSAANESAATTTAKASNTSGVLGTIAGLFSDENAKVPVGSKTPTPAPQSKLDAAYDNWKVDSGTAKPTAAAPGSGASGLTFLGQPLFPSNTAPTSPITQPRPVMANPIPPSVMNIPGGLWSDIHSKDALGDVNDAEIDRFLSSVKPKEFKYNDSAKAAGAPDGDQTGVLAQDVEKSKIGKRLVTKDPKTGYKQIDVPQTVGTLLATAASLNSRLKKVEGRNNG
ncbi:MAG: tail fiber domain-containing protein [Steroidobacteraceae bacterium]